MDSNMNSDSSDWRSGFLKTAAVILATLISMSFLSDDISVIKVIIGVGVIATVSWLCDRKTKVERLPIKNKVILVTGCDSGFGHELAVSLSIQGAVVYAGCLDKNGEDALSLLDKGSQSRLNLLQLDVTNMQQIEQAKDRIAKDIGNRGLWAVVNNAGLNFLGDIELTTMGQFELVNNINYLGVVRVTKAFLPLVRSAKGRFVNVTSVKGLFSEPFNGAYGTTKYAVEAFTDILRMEMKKFNVLVSAVEPCNFGGATKAINLERMQKDFDEMWQNLTVEQKSIYGSDYFSAHIKFVQDAIPTASLETYKVVDAMEEALFSVKPKTRYLVPGGSGWIEMYRWRSYVKPFLPDWLMDYWLMKGIEHYPAVHDPSSSL